MSIYRIDPEHSKEDDIVLVNLSDRAHAETIVELLDPHRGVRFQPRHLPPQPHVPGPRGWRREVSVFDDRARAKAWVFES